MENNGIAVFKVKVTTNVQNVSECFSGQYLLNWRIFCHQTWHGYAAATISQSVMQKKWFTDFNVKVTARAYDQNMTISLVSSKALVGLQSNLV